MLVNNIIYTMRRNSIIFKRPGKLSIGQVNASAGNGCTGLRGVFENYNKPGSICVTISILGKHLIRDNTN